jgi:hypothetical protein
MTEGNEEVVSLDLNVPALAYTNSGTAGAAFNISEAAVTGYPAHKRGLYYNGTTSGSIALPELLKPYSFSLHTWLLPKSLASPMAVFSTDRNDFTFAADEIAVHTHFDVTILATTGKLQICLARDIDATDYNCQECPS